MKAKDYVQLSTFSDKTLPNACFVLFSKSCHEIAQDSKHRYAILIRIPITPPKMMILYIVALDR